MTDVLIFTRPDGVKVHIVKADIVEWYADDSLKGTRIVELSGFRVVLETVDQVAAAYNG